MAQKRTTTNKKRVLSKKTVRETRAQYATKTSLLSRITVNPRILHGKPCIRGFRIPVYLIVGLVARGLSFDEILADYPDLERDDIKAALEYAAFVTRENIIPAQIQTVA